MTPSALYVPSGGLATLPNGQQIALPWFVPSPRAIKDRERLLAGQFFLVNIARGAAGEIWRCRRCRGKHRYLTLMCVEQPFSGLTGGLYAYWHTVGAHGAEAFLTTSERARLDAIAAQINPGRADLASSHPETARAIGTGERDADVGALALGLLEPIKADKARDLVRRINMRAGGDVLTLPGLAA